MRQGHVIDDGDQRAGALLREARLRIGLTQQELAIRLGWSADTLASYETGRRGLRVAHLFELATVLALPPAALFIDEVRAGEVLRRLSSAERWAQISLFRLSRISRSAH